MKFESAAKFDLAEFRCPITFNNAEFKSTTSFRRASFGRPPKFFEATLHEDLDSTQIDWKNAEQSYNRGHRCNKLNASNDSIEHDAGNAVRAWDRLALIMSRQEKLAERHEFFRLKLRAQRQRDGRCLLSLANWLFDVSSDYGWGVRRAFCWWIGQMAFGAAILAGTALVCGRAFDISSWPQIVGSGLLVSFANSLSFLRLGSEGGYLHGPREVLMNAAGQAEWAFIAVGTIQAVLGPVLLFLVLLTLRNRFRLDRTSCRDLTGFLRAGKDTMLFSLDFLGVRPGRRAFSACH